MTLPTVHLQPRKALSRRYAAMAPWHAAVRTLVALLLASTRLTDAALINPSQGAVLAECAAAWGQPLDGWSAGNDCSAVKGVTCDSNGMVTRIDLSSSELTGTIPAALGSLSSLVHLYLSSNQLKGTLPTSLGNLRMLTHLDLSTNFFTSSIPMAFSQLTNLKRFDISGSTFQGSFPMALLQITGLTSIHMSTTAITGTIPNAINALQRLKSLNLKFTGISGSIPRSIGEVVSLEYLGLSQASFLTGTIPDTIGNLTKLTHLGLADTKLGGSIPSSLGRLTALESLDLGGTSLTGTLPADLGALNRARYISIPVGMQCGLEGPCLLQQNFSSAFCRLCSTFCAVCYEGSAPLTSPPPPAPLLPSPPLSSSPSLPPAPPPSATPSSYPPSPSIPSSSSPLSTGAIIGIAVGGVLLLLLVVAGVGMFCWGRKGEGTAATAKPATAKPASAKPTSSAAGGSGRGGGSSKSKEGAAGGVLRLASMRKVPQCPRYSWQQVCEATHDWAEDRRVGAGRWMDTYRGANLENARQQWAFKRRREPSDAFEREVKDFFGKKNTNLVKLVGCCTHTQDASASDQGGKSVEEGEVREEQILIFEWMGKGCLEQRMGPDSPHPLSLKERIDVGIGTAKGLKYLQSFSLLHGNLSPSNILLDNVMQPRLSDHSGVRLGEQVDLAAERLLPRTSHYMDPALLEANWATPTTDVYSLGILLMELISGRRAGAGDLTVDGEPASLREWVQHTVTTSDISVLRDPHLDAPDDLILQVAKIALQCTAAMPPSRPTMVDVADRLQELKKEHVVVSGSRRLITMLSMKKRPDGPKPRGEDEELRMAFANLENENGGDQSVP